MTDPFIGEIIQFGGNFAPRGWALCDGQLLSISQNQALFSILGTTFGGDGRTTFGLPDIRGRSMVHPGTGPGLPNVRLGEKGGSVTIPASAMPSHSHPVRANSGAGTVSTPTSNFLATAEDQNRNGINIYATTANVDMGNTGNNSGGGGEFRNPYIGINHIIALIGTFPSRN